MTCIFTYYFIIYNLKILYNKKNSAAIWLRNQAYWLMFLSSSRFPD